MVGHKSSESNHCKTSILEFLLFKISSALVVSGVKLEVVNSWLSSAKVGLSLKSLLVLVSLKDTAEEDKLGPPLGIGLHDSIDGIGGGDVSGVEGSENLGEEPTNGGEHGGAAVGEFGLAGPFGRDVVTEAKGIELKSTNKCGKDYVG